MALPPDFDEQVRALVAQIPPGRVLTYGMLARLVGAPALARRAGRALSHAPASVPCHRVVSASGRTAPGWPGQRELLEAEGVRLLDNGRVDLGHSLWRLFDEQ